jgi:serine-type D-Ala-D-Ala carboxypeptidase/endopeptidase (penicillin-binding protein 4)
MRIVFLILAALTSNAADLEHRIDTIADATRAFVGIHVVDLASGKTVYHRNDDRLLVPASNMKLFTSALALVRLGADYRFTTQLVRESSGGIAMIGSGDPSMSGRAFPYQKDALPGPPLKAIEDLADQAVAAGLRRVDGDVAGDDRLYPWAPYAPSWTQDDALRDYGAPVSALSVNDNALTIAVKPGARSGDMAELSIDPPIEYYAIDNRITTTAGRGEPKIRISRDPGSRQILLWGSIPASHATVRETVAIDDPALFTRRGVAITGRPIARHRSATDDYEGAGTMIASRTSPPLIQLLQLMDKVSQNLYAELMLREVGRVTRHTATREAGLEEMDAMLSEIGVPKDDARIEDGSGLGRNAMVTPRSITRLLAYMSASKSAAAWMTLLPAAGGDGTLQHRMCCASEEFGIRAKTGSLSRVVALSGYATSKTRGRLAFSILVNDFAEPSAAVREWVDKIATALLE